MASMEQLMQTLTQKNQQLQQGMQRKAHGSGEVLQAAQAGKGRGGEGKKGFNDKEFSCLDKFDA